MGKKKKSKRKVKITMEVDYDEFFGQLARDKAKKKNPHGFTATLKIEKNKKKYSRKKKHK